ncbi:ATP-grasp domain-containing protein [Actinoplanes couchii]|uniref:ATP-grasp domain-containing protein n=1 Tax=Actinoplanes couchii TaxID=403638 RepID=A0ABQ3XF00_9ACTN|nr:ATP-grasp domain-containing protein [Actinoplanes couchii]MDR6321959.1 carbamoyl-phosphate synthase large subunit [Actinoplanes couchii]GID57084.1 hypothetical protein Aco03nite_054880 [Actinoplanes couchii]
MSLVDKRLGTTLDRQIKRRTTIATVRRRRLVFLEMIGAVVFCVGGYLLWIDPVRFFEVRLASKIIELMGVDRISGALGDGFVVFGPNLEPVVAEMTGSCSILSSVLALAALAVLALRQRPQALLGFLAASAFVMAANQVRLLGSLLAGRYLAVDALVFFHDWIGAVLNFAYTLIGLLIMIGLTMYDAERAEQDRAGRHTADRPAAWARPGLGHRVSLDPAPVDSAPVDAPPKLQIAAVIHRRILPKALSRRLAQRREQRRIDYRVGHETPARRAEIVRDLAAKGLGVHTATLLAVASYETDPLVLDALAGAIAQRQWEPIAGGDVIALRLWARAWLMRAPRERTVAETGRLVAVTGAGGPAGVAVIRALQAAGEHVLALDANPDAVGLRLAGRHAVVPRADHPAYAETLLAVVAEHRPVALIGTVAEEYGVLSPLAGALAGLGVRTWLPDPDAADLCLDKVAFATTMHAAGVPHPATAWTAATAGQVPGPWVVKPARGRGSRDVVLVDDPAELAHAFASVPDAIVQTRLAGREFTADALVARDGTLVACVPRWRDETRGGISVRGTTFESLAVTELVTATLAAVRHTGPANVQGFLNEHGEATVVEVNPRFSGGLPLTLAAGADVVGTYLTGILDPFTPLGSLGFQPGVRMSRHFAELYYTADGTPVPDPLSPTTVSVPNFTPPPTPPLTLAVPPAPTTAPASAFPAPALPAIDASPTTLPVGAATATAAALPAPVASLFSTGFPAPGPSVVPAVSSSRAGHPAPVIPSPAADNPIPAVSSSPAAFPDAAALSASGGFPGSAYLSTPAIPLSLAAFLAPAPSPSAASVPSAAPSATVFSTSAVPSASAGPASSAFPSAAEFGGADYIPSVSADVARVAATRHLHSLPDISDIPDFGPGAAAPAAGDSETRTGGGW